LRAVDKRLARWLAWHFSCDYPDDFLSILAIFRGRMNPLLWEEICLRLHITNMNRPSKEVFSKWVALLVAHPKALEPKNPLSNLLSVLRLPEDTEIAFLLFSHLTRPMVSTKYRPYNEQLLEITFAGDNYWLYEAWHKIYLPNLDLFAKRFEILLEQHLRLCFELQVSTGITKHGYDLMSRSRETIDSPGSAPFQREDIFDLLVDAAREILSWFSSHAPTSLAEITKRWWDSGAPMLKRLAVHAMTISSVPAETKLSWLIEKDLLYSWGYENEVVKALENAYPHASSVARFELTKVVLKGPQEPNFSIDIQYKESLIFYMLGKLVQSAPDCALASSLLSEAQSRNPNLVLDSIMETQIKPVFELTIDELLMRPIEDLVKLSNEQWSCTPLQLAAAQNLSWSLSLAEALAAAKKWDNGVWKNLVSAWRETPLSKDVWSTILRLLEDHKNLFNCADSITWLLGEGLKEASLPIELEGKFAY
jgi:hypothetical protein